MMRYPDTAQFYGVLLRGPVNTIWDSLQSLRTSKTSWTGHWKGHCHKQCHAGLTQQSPAAIDKIVEIFYLSQGEKQLLLAATLVKEFFCRSSHAPIRVVSSEDEKTYNNQAPGYCKK